MVSSDVQSVQTFTKELQFFPKLKSAAFDLLAVLLSEDETLRDALLIHSCSNKRSMFHTIYMFTSGRYENRNKRIFKMKRSIALTLFCRKYMFYFRLQTDRRRNRK